MVVARLGFLKLLLLVLMVRTSSSSTSTSGGDCVPVGMTAADGDCSVSSAGCCDEDAQCYADGTCLLPPGCTDDDSCDEGEVCIGGNACVAEDAVVTLSGFENEDDPALISKVKIGTEELSIYGETNDTTGAPLTLSEVTMFSVEIGAMVHIVFDEEEQRLVSAYFDGLPDKVVNFVYDSDGVLVGATEEVVGTGPLGRRLDGSLDGGSGLQRGHLDQRMLLVGENCEACCDALLDFLFPRIGTIEISIDLEINLADSVFVRIALRVAVSLPFYPQRLLLEGACIAACELVGGYGDPHIVGLSGQHFEISGVDGGWYSMMRDEEIDLHVNARFTAPEATEEFSDRQYITGVAVLTNGHSLVIEVRNPYDVTTDGCPSTKSPCILDGGLRILADGKEVDWVVSSTRSEHVVDDIELSAANLPVECRKFGAEKIWAKILKQLLRRERALPAESFEDWVLKDDDITAHEWCAKYIADHGLDDVRSMHAILRIATPSAVIRLNAGTKRGFGRRKGHRHDKRSYDIEFWRMDLGFEGLYLGHPDKLSGIIGETARPVLDAEGRKILKGTDALRGTAEDYRVSHALDMDFKLLQMEGRSL